MKLPPSVAKQTMRETQKEIPKERAQREAFKRYIASYVAAEKPVAPLTDAEINKHVDEIIAGSGADEAYRKYLTVLFNNECWKEGLAAVPYEKRLLLLPKCLRVEAKCPAPFDEFGLLCKQCGLCTIEDLEKEAHRLGYAVLVAEGSTIVMQLIETNKIAAIVGVSCLSVLEKAYPFMEAAAVPGIAIPLLQDDCVDTNVDVEWVWDVIHLTADDKTHRLDLDRLKEVVQGMFSSEGLEEIMGPVAGQADRLGRESLLMDGKRLRPYLAACAAKALKADNSYALEDSLKKVLLAIECFHKASLIHDDIEDEDKERYGKATLHESEGLAVALNVGDYLLGEGYRLLAASGLEAEKIVEMIAIASQGHRDLSLGQGEELAWYEHPKKLSSLEVLDIFSKKTSPAFEVALRLGAVFAGAEDEVHDTLKKYSESLGIAFQIKDDMDDFEVLRPSLYLSLALEKSKGEDKEYMAALWERKTEVDSKRITAIVESCRVEKRCVELLEAYKEATITTLMDLKNPSLKGLMRRVIGKIFNDIEIKGWCSEFEEGNVAGREISSSASS